MAAIAAITAKPAIADKISCISSNMPAQQMPGNLQAWLPRQSTLYSMAKRLHIKHCTKMWQTQV